MPLFHLNFFSYCRHYLSLGVILAVPWLAFNAEAEVGASVDRLRICLEIEDYPPYFFKPINDPANAARTGILIELIDKCAETAGLEVEYLSKPWRRCLADVKDSRVDALAPIIWSQSRQAWANFPKDDNNQLVVKAALISTDYSVFTHRNSSLVWDGERFTGVRYGVAAPLGHLTHHRLKHMGVVSASTFPVADGLRMVSRGFLDGFVTESLSGRFIAKNHGYDNLIVEAQPVFLSAEMYLVFSNAYADTHSQQMHQMWNSLIHNGEAWRHASLREYGLVK